jgi:hypothetical protein
LDNYFNPTTVEELRESIERSIDRGTAALKVGELMDKHGNEDWLEPFMNEIGPHLQVQINDLANLLEVVYK